MVHRDLKPSNILIDENCDLKICDFGLARVVEDTMTGYVTTRYYRAPETMLTWRQYNVEIDMWSAGCILAEMIEGKPLFPGHSHADQLLVIFDVLGSVPPHIIQKISSRNVRLQTGSSVISILIFLQASEYVESLPQRARQPLGNKLKRALPDGMDDRLSWFKKNKLAN